MGFTDRMPSLSLDATPKSAYVTSLFICRQAYFIISLYKDIKDIMELRPRK
jgi:hypothetical protein